jgi:hypothetical protein
MPPLVRDLVDSCRHVVTGKGCRLPHRNGESRPVGFPPSVLAEFADDAGIGRDIGGLVQDD